MPKGMKVIVLKPGIYNNENHRANDPADVGDVIIVASGPYFTTLVEEGKVSEYDPASFQSMDIKAERDVDEAWMTVEYGSNVTAETTKEDGRSTIEYRPEVTTEAIAAEDAKRHSSRWEDLKDAGITDQAAMTLYKAGIRNQRDVQIIMAQPKGAENLLALKGIGSKTVDQLFEWAEGWEE